MVPSWSMLDHHIVLTKLLEPASKLILRVLEVEQLNTAMVIRANDKFTAKQVMSVHVRESDNC